VTGFKTVGSRPATKKYVMSAPYAKNAMHATAAALRVDAAIGSAARMTKYMRNIGVLSASVADCANA
jgi:hypothetical protein